MCIRVRRYTGIIFSIMKLIAIRIWGGHFVNKNSMAFTSVTEIRLTYPSYHYIAVNLKCIAVNCMSIISTVN